MESQTNPVPTEDDKSILDSGELTFRVRAADGTVTDHKMDLLRLKLTCEECESTHGLEIVDGKIQPTAAFVADLAGRLDEMGVCGCTGTVAWQIWLAAFKQMALIKN